MYNIIKIMKFQPILSFGTLAKSAKLRLRQEFIKDNKLKGNASDKRLIDTLGVSNANELYHLMVNIHNDVAERANVNIERQNAANSKERRAIKAKANKEFIKKNVHKFKAEWCDSDPIGIIYQLANGKYPIGLLGDIRQMHREKIINSIL